MLPLHFQDQTIAFTFWAKEFAADELLVTAFAADEAIFGMTRIEVMLSSQNAHIDLEKLMDASATLTVHHKYLAEKRHFSGIVVEAECGDSGLHRTAYRVVLMPTLYRLDHGSDCRIFQQNTVPDIIETILGEHGVQDVKWILEQSHLQREYAVAYRETHLAFLERIMAEEGIFYYFEHDKEGKHTLVISDTPQVLADCPGQKELEYNNLAIRAVDEVYCSSLNYRKKLRSTTFVQADYSFKNPNYGQFHASQAAKLAGEKHDYELYNYPGRYKSDAAGRPFTQYKLEATRVDASIAYGVSNTPLLLSGHGVTLTSHINKELNCKWRLLTIRHEGVQPQAWQEDGQGVPATGISAIASSLNSAELGGLSFDISGSHSPNVLHKMLGRGLQIATRQQVQEDFDAAARACVYANAFTAQPANLPYRAPQSAKPMIDGSQIAIVVGPPNEEIYTDEYGRVRVHFPWDRHHEPDAENSSCWIRVSQAWGGGMYGNMAVPRIGHEVIVSFLDGDPDQPIIIGRAYHEVNKSPYALPDHKTKMVIRSDSHKAKGFNELSFEDEGGRENMFLHAQKDQTIKVLNNQTQRIDANASQSIGANQAIEVGKNLNHQIGGGMNQVVGAVGSAAVGLLSGALAPLMGQSAGLLQQGMKLAMQVMQAKGGGSGGKQGSPAILQTDEAKKIAAQPLPAKDGKDSFVTTAPPSEATPDETVQPSNPPDASHDATALMQEEASGFANALSGGGTVAGMATIAQGLEAARNGINAAAHSELFQQGGASMALAGAGMGQNVAGMVGGGILNQLVAKFHNTSTGIAKTEQIGQVKVTTVGQVHTEQAGNTRQIYAGEKFIIAVGKNEDTGEPMAQLIMDNTGHIQLIGVTYDVTTSKATQVKANPLKLNCKG